MDLKINISPLSLQINKGIKINNDMFQGTDIDYFKDKTMGDLMEVDQKDLHLNTYKKQLFL